MNIQSPDFKLELGDPLGSGREGTCYEINNTGSNNLLLKNMVVKVMNKNNLVTETFNHIAKLLPHNIIRRFCEHPSLKALTIYPFIDQDGKCCLIMPRVFGKELGDVDVRRAFMKLTMIQRLIIAFHIASGIEIIHDQKIIDADIASENIIIDIDKLEAYIIDIDGGGIVGLLPPRVQGHADLGLAPELRADPKRIPDQYSDLWSLAVVLHRILTCINPYYFYDTVNEIIHCRSSWPPATIPDQYKIQTTWHQKALIEMGDELANMFRNVFSSGQDDKLQIYRPSAVHWRKAISNKLTRLPVITKICPQCHGDHLPWNQIYCDCDAVLHQTPYKCPNCKSWAPINAAYCPNCGKLLS